MVECTIVCLDCRVAAPHIGDYGFLGWPSMLETPTVPTARQWEFLERPFGYIRKTFLDMGICVDEIEQFAVFMRQHDGHNLGAAAEGQLQHFAEGGQAIVDEIEESGQIGTPLSYEEPQSRAHDGFVVGRYTLRCRCGASYLTPEPTVLRPLPEVQWTADLVTRLRDILALESDFWLMSDRLLDPGSEEDDPPPSLRQIEAFVSTHLTHGVSATVTRDTTV